MSVKSRLGVVTTLMIFSSGAAADSASVAVELLIASAKCPLPYQKVQDAFPQIKTQQFLGDQQKFRFQRREKTCCAEYEPIKYLIDDYEYSAKISDLSGVFISKYNNATIIIKCKRELDCINWTLSQSVNRSWAPGLGANQQMTQRETEIYFCDAENADNARIAIEELIKLNSGSSR
jgi:hypothetical protein